MPADVPISSMPTAWKPRWRNRARAAARIASRRGEPMGGGGPLMPVHRTGGTFRRDFALSGNAKFVTEASPARILLLGKYSTALRRMHVGRGLRGQSGDHHGRRRRAGPATRPVDG